MNPALDILYILAHPDDESFGHAGTMILAREMGFRTGYICATRGEAGMIRDESLATRASLAARRELELRRAMTLAGLEELRILPYRDSGMEGTPENDDPRCLLQADEDEVTAFLVAATRELRPRVVVGFGPEGIYRHPDHIRIGKITDRAVLDAAGDNEHGLGDPWKIEAHYHVAAPRERMIANSINPESPYYNRPVEYFDVLGSLSADITHWIDISSVGERKYTVLMQHATQISSANPVTDPNSQMHKNMMSTETLIRQSLPWDEAADDPITQIRDAWPATYP